ncbi:unnamed protein product [Parnassius mnemosyne]|uniref:Tetraspanin n=1 Tax=Parnassius mnemosyne TaxID=213953 RepID=A0AAV1KR25_9NEOP
MGMSRCYALMKCLLILFNIIFLVVGVGACAFCGWALWEGYGGAGAGAGRAGLWCVGAWGALLTAGAASCVRGACGGAGGGAALRGGLALLALACAAEAAAAAWGAAHAPALRQALHERLRDTVAHEYGLLPARTHMLDAIQQGLQCCGAEGLRDWQDSAWAGGEHGAGGEAGEGGVVGAAGALDLSVSAPALYYWVPASCCATEDAYECEAARRVRVGGEAGGGGALHGAGCGARAAGALAAAARGPLCAAAALLAAHVLALLLALALALTPKPHTPYKA